MKVFVITFYYSTYYESVENTVVCKSYDAIKVEEYARLNSFTYHVEEQYVLDEYPDL